MRVANIIEESKIGGPQLRMLRVASVLRGRVDTLIIMPLSNSDDLISLCEQRNIRYITMQLTTLNKRITTLLRYFFHFPLEIFSLARVLKRERIDLVHVSGGSWQYKGVIAGSLVGIPVIWHLNDSLMPSVILYFFKFLSKYASGFIVASFKTELYYKKFMSKRPISVISSCVDVDQTLVSSKSTSGVECDRFIAQDPCIGILANINPIKGLDVLIRAIPIVKSHFPTVKVLIVGAVHLNQQDYFKSLLHLAECEGVSENITWYGASRSVNDMLVQMDVYVCSSVAESSPASVWEAMAASRPIVSTAVGDVPRHLIDGKRGYVVNVGDHRVLAERILKLLHDPILRFDFGKAAHDASREFSVEEVALKTEIFYREILSVKSK